MDNDETTDEPHDSSTMIAAKDDHVSPEPRRSSRAANKKRYCEADSSDGDDDFEESFVPTSREATEKRRKTTGNKTTGNNTMLKEMVPSSREAAEKRRKTTGNKTTGNKTTENINTLKEMSLTKKALRTPLRAIQENARSPVCSIKKITNSRWEPNTEDWREYSVLDY